MYVDANVIVVSSKASLNTLDRQNNVNLAIKYPHSGPKAATCKRLMAISPARIKTWLLNSTNLITT
jgi:hypothetical protein